MKQKSALFQFKPFSKKQRQILNWWTETSPVKDYDGLIADGAIRSGKSLCMSLSFVMWAMSTFDGENFAMCGKTVGSFRRNVLVWLKRMLAGRGYEFTDRRADNLLTVRRGDVENDFYIFGGRDERSQDFIQGITLAGVFLDEVALMPESFVNQATGRCSVDGSKMWFNCNPSYPSHWFKAEWIDKRESKNILYLHFMMDDNLSLSERVRQRYRNMYTGVFYDRYIRGLWVMAEGLIFPMYKDALVDTIPQEPPTSEMCMSIDYGTLNAFAALLWEKKGDVWYATNGYYYSGRDSGIQKTDGEYLTDIEERFSNEIGLIVHNIDESVRTRVPVRKLEVIIDPSAASFIALLQKTKWAKVRRADNDVMNGLRETASAITTGKFKVLRSIKEWEKEAGGYVWDDNLEGEERPVKINDHYMDASRYFAKTKRLMKINRTM